MRTFTVYVNRLNPHWPKPTVREGHHIFDRASCPFGADAHLCDAESADAAVASVLDGRRKDDADRRRST